MPQTELNTHQSQSGYHRLHVLMKCPRAFGYAEILKLRRPVDSRGPALGSAVHEALAMHYLGRSWKEAFEGPRQRWSYMIPEASRIMEAYLRAYPVETFKTLAVEHEFRIDLYGKLFTRRVDLVALHPDGKVWIKDHKTAGQMSRRKRGIHRDPSLWTQDVVGALCVEQEFGHPYGGLECNLIETARKKGPDGEDVHNFERVPIMAPPQMIRDSYASLNYWLTQADNWVNSGVDVFDMPQTWRCNDDYGCDYLELCEFGRDAMNRFEVGR